MYMRNGIAWFADLLATRKTIAAVLRLAQLFVPSLGHRIARTDKNLPILACPGPREASQREGRPHRDRSGEFEGNLPEAYVFALLSFFFPLQPCLRQLLRQPRQDCIILTTSSNSLFLKYLDPERPAQEVIDSKVCPRLIALLAHDSNHIQVRTLAIRS